MQSQVNAIHILTLYFSKLHFNTFPSTLKSSKFSSSQVFQQIFVCISYLSHTYYIPTHIVRPDVVIRMIIDEEKKL